MFRKKILTFLIGLEHFCEAHPLQVMPFLISKFLVFFDTLSCFASVRFRVLNCSKKFHARRIGNFTSEITLNDEYLSQFLSDSKVLRNKLSTHSLNSHFSKQQSNMRIVPGVKSTLCPIWMKKGPKNLKNFIGFLSAVALNRSKVQDKDIRKLHC